MKNIFNTRRPSTPATPTPTHSLERKETKNSTLECKENNEMLKNPEVKNVNKSKNRLTPAKLDSKKQDKKVLASRVGTGHVPSSISLILYCRRKFHYIHIWTSFSVSRSWINYQHSSKRDGDGAIIYCFIYDLNFRVQTGFQVRVAYI